MSSILFRGRGHGKRLLCSLQGDIRYYDTQQSSATGRRLSNIKHRFALPISAAVSAAVHDAISPVSAAPDRTTPLPCHCSLSVQNPSLKTMSTAQTRTILGPLTTTFTPTPACSAQVLECPLPTCTLAWQAQTCYSSGDSAGIEDNSDCWPPRSGSVTESTHNPTLAGWGFYSPGLVCPSGFVSACSATFGESWGWPVQYSIFEGETAVGCCPRYRSGGVMCETAISQD